MIGIGELRWCSCLYSYDCTGAVGGGGVRGVRGEGSSEDIQGSGWLKNHLSAISVQQQ